MEVYAFVYLSFFMSLFFSLVWKTSNLLNTMLKMAFIGHTLWAALIILEWYVPLLFATVKG